MIGGFEEMKFGPDGTAYWSNFTTSIGRWAPPYANAPEKAWAKVPDEYGESITRDALSLAWDYYLEVPSGDRVA